MLRDITIASAVTALLVLNGCGGGTPPKGDGNPPADTGIEIPSELSQKADINDSTAGRFMHDFYDDMDEISVSSNLKTKLPIKLKTLAKPLSEGNVTITDRACSEGGTFSFKSEVSETTESDMNITTKSFECSANNCKMNASDYDDNQDYIDLCSANSSFYIMSNKPEVENSIRTYNGYIKLVRKYSKSANEDTIPQKKSRELSVTVDNLTYTKESNSSEQQRYKFANGKVWSKIIYMDNNTSSSRTWSVKIDYTYKNYDRNKTNPAQIFNGDTYTQKVNWDWNQEANDTHKELDVTVDGYLLAYNVSGSESNKTINPESWAYDNVTYKATGDGNVSTISIDGGVNEHATCGKMINVATDKIVKHNRTFKDGDGNTGESVLPYDGKVTLEGDKKAEASFNVDNENKTSMTLKIDGVEAENSPYHKWDEVPRHNCAH